MGVRARGWLVRGRGDGRGEGEKMLRRVNIWALQLRGKVEGGLRGMRGSICVNLAGWDDIVPNRE